MEQLSKYMKWPGMAQRRKDEKRRSDVRAPERHDLCSLTGDTVLLLRLERGRGERHIARSTWGDVSDVVFVLVGLGLGWVRSRRKILVFEKCVLYLQMHTFSIIRNRRVSVLRSFQFGCSCVCGHAGRVYVKNVGWIDWSRSDDISKMQVILGGYLLFQSLIRPQSSKRMELLQRLLSVVDYRFVMPS